MNFARRSGKQNTVFTKVGNSDHSIATVTGAYLRSAEGGMFRTAGPSGRWRTPYY
jgi:hypothetical protein